MFSFAHIEYLLLLAALIPVAVLFVLNGRWKKKTRKKIGDEQLVNLLTANHSKKKFSAKFYFLFVAIALTALGAANLRTAGKAENVNRKGRDIVVAMDVSKSMLADDVKPTRLDKSKQFVSKLMDQLPDDRIALIWFAGKAYLPMPLTADQGAAKLFVQSASPDAVPTQGTVIGEALRLASESFPQESKRYKIVLLITDGEDHDESAVTMARQLKDRGILLLCIGLGTIEGSPIADPTTKDFKKDNLGQTVVTKLNEPLLRQLASVNGGLYGNLQNTDEMLEEITAVINQLEKKGVEGEVSNTNYNNYFTWFLVAAALFLLIELFIRERKTV
ncbi:VWA domain-containing protein [Lacibacter sp. H407]|uniref:VWA domain-containing protein n=1 Tax=Lacibacter sp. H407 TaxID=3133423 RepID=UPI0030BD0D63